MSRAGKFIPGGAARKTAPMGVQGPVRGPGPSGESPKKEGGRLISKAAGLTRPVPKNRRLPILIMSSFVCCLLVSVAWYECGVLPAKRQLALEQQKAQAVQKQLDDELAAQKAKAAAAAQAPPSAIVIVDSRPPGTVTIGHETKPTPATFDDVPAGKAAILVQADGFDDYRQNLFLNAEKPTDLGTISLVPKTGDLVLSTPQKEVAYTLTGPNGYTHEGELPDKLGSLSVGTYQLTVRQRDWQLPPMSIVIQGHDTVEKNIRFPFGSVSIATTPGGATVHNGNVILGQTPLTLGEVRPGDLNLSVDLPPYQVERLALSVPDSGHVSRQITLTRDKDFIAACGMPMVWVPDGGYWAGKYEVTQRVFESLMNYNPSTFRRPNHPVENLPWEMAMTFCEKLNQSEQRAGKLPAGYRYTLPTESQWDTFSADASIDLAATSRNAPLSSTQDVGASEPNKYGLYDTIGNVWEWSLDAVDDKGAHGMRGGSWLSSTENFPSAETHSAGAAKYADRFTGFRVILAPQ
jgi:hypothetical protein